MNSTLSKDEGKVAEGGGGGEERLCLKSLEEQKKKEDKVNNSNQNNGSSGSQVEGFATPTNGISPFQLQLASQGSSSSSSLLGGVFNGGRKPRFNAYEIKKFMTLTQIKYINDKRNGNGLKFDDMNDENVYEVLMNLSHTHLVVLCKKTPRGFCGLTEEDFTEGKTHEMLIKHIIDQYRI